MDNGKHFGKISIPPVGVMLGVLLLVVLVQVAALYLMTQQPWTGLRLQPDPASAFLRVAAVAANSPASGKIQPGDILVALQVNGDIIPLTPSVLLDWKEVPTYAEYNRVTALQQRLHDGFAPGQALQFVDSTGRHIGIVPANYRPLFAIPMVYWWSLLNIIGVLIGTFVWISKPASLEGGLFLTASFGHYCLSTGYAALFVRDLFLDAALLHVVTALQIFAMHIFIFGVFSIHVFYPQRLLPVKALYLTAAIHVLLAVNYYQQWFEVPFHLFFFPLIAYLLVFMGISWLQWRASKGKPVNRAAVLILQLSPILVSVAALLLYVLPLMLNTPPLLNGGMINFFPEFIFASWAVAILRYRLFDVEHWWFKAWLWLLGGVLVAMIDIMLLSALHTSQVYSLGLSVLVAGFLYFPLRQWLMGKVMPLDSQSVQAFLPTFSALMGSAVFRDEFEQRWQEALRIRFQPLHLSVQPHAVPLAALADNGLHLDVPSLSGVNSYRLTGKQMGMRLFGKNNLKTTTSLLDVARIASNASERRQQAVLTERTRIMHDLHDTVGAKLLTLSHMLPTAKHKQAAQESLQTLRDMINLTLQKAPLTLGESLADWRLEAMECAEATNVELRWQVAPALESLELRPGQTIELLLFVRATLQQMMASATLQQLTVHFSLAEKQLCVRITAADNPLAAVTHTLNFT